MPDFILTRFGAKPAYPWKFWEGALEVGFDKEMIEAIDLTLDKYGTYCNTPNCKYCGWVSAVKWSGWVTNTLGDIPFEIIRCNGCRTRSFTQLDIFNTPKLDPEPE